MFSGGQTIADLVDIARRFALAALALAGIGLLIEVESSAMELVALL
jgi:hypothetical protein